MKVVQVAGFLGSGKTTTLLAIARKISAKQKKKIAIIVNEIGEVPVDAKVISDFGLRVIEIGSGCICCELASNMAYTLKELGEKFNPDMVFIEPTGVALPEQVNSAIELGKHFIKIEIGRVVVLFDALRGDELLSYDELKDFVMRQLNGADIIAINKTDSATPEQTAFCEKKLRELCPRAEIVKIAAITGDGVEYLISLIENGKMQLGVE